MQTTQQKNANFEHKTIEDKLHTKNCNKNVKYEHKIAMKSKLQA